MKIENPGKVSIDMLVSPTVCADCAAPLEAGVFVWLRPVEPAVLFANESVCQACAAPVLLKAWLDEERARLGSDDAFPAHSAKITRDIEAAIERWRVAGYVADEPGTR